MRDIWFNHPPAFRRRVLILLGLVALLAAVKVVSSSGSSSGEDGGAIAFVPADAYAYAHVDLDSSQAADALSVSERLPDFRAILGGLGQTLAPGDGLDLQRDLAPWIGSEAAFAEVPATGGAPKPLFIASVGEPKGADDFLTTVGGQPTGRVRYKGDEVTTYRGGRASAEHGGFLLFGDSAVVRSALATAADPDESLESEDVAEQVRGDLPDDRFADLYLSQDALPLLRSGQAGGALDTFTDFDASEGIAMAATATDDGFELQVSSVLDPGKVEADPGFLSAFPPFDPSLAGLFDPHTLALVQIGDPSKTVKGLLDQAEAVEPGISAAYERLRAQLKRTEGFDLNDDLLPELGDQMAIGLAPGKGGPYLTAAFDGVDEGQARAAVARLAGPLIASVNPARTGQAPSFSQADIDGVKVIGLQLSPTTTISVATFDGHLIVTTDPRGLKRAIDGKDGLTGESAYQAVGDVGSGDPSALLFLDLRGLVDFGEPIGLTGIRNYDRFKQDFAKLGALGVRVSTEKDKIDTDITLQIDQGDQDK